MSHFSRPACAVASGEVREEVAMSGCVTPHFQRGIMVANFAFLYTLFKPCTDNDASTKATCK